MQPKKFSWHGRLKSFLFAFEGLAFFFRREHNAWIHGVATVLVLLAAMIAQVSRLEIIAILLVIGLVWISEMFNTAIEKMMDHFSPQRHPDIKAIKDIAAGAVLIAACSAFITGLIIFIPKIL
ncbi:MAG: diacylglycerol kinase family protein [Chitinophagaceae bacterium]